MNRAAQALVGIILGVIPASGQVVQGQVVDSVTQLPLLAVTVSLLDADGRVVDAMTTAANGAFLLAPGAVGSFSLRTRKDGYRPSVFPRFRLEAPDERAFILLVSPTAVSAPDNIKSRVCDPETEAPGARVILGFVRDANLGNTFPGTNIVLAWPRPQLVEGVPLPDVVRVLPVDSAGTYVACDIPAEIDITLHAETSELLSDFATIRFTTGGVAARDGLHVMDHGIWRQDFVLKPTAQHTGRITGVVTRAAGGAPIVGAVVAVPLMSIETRTNTAGAFVIENLPAGTFVVHGRSPGFRPRATEITLRSNETHAVSAEALRLETGPVELSPVVIEAISSSPRRPLNDFLRRREHGSGDYLTRAEFEKLGSPQTPTDVLRRMQGLRIYANPNYQQPFANPRKEGIDGRRWVISNHRGGPRSFQQAVVECPPLMFLDGFFLGDPWYVNIDDVIALANIEAVEVYRSVASLPAELNRTGSACGAVVFWTR